jgi:hypothetical protein
MRTTAVSLVIVLGTMLGFAAPATASVPGNDRLGNAELIRSLPYDTRATTTRATRTAGEDAATTCHSRPQATVWYSFRAPQTMRIGAHTVGSDYIPTLAAFTGSRDRLREVACNRPGYKGAEPRVSFRVTEGTRYWFSVGSTSSAGGRLRLRVVRLGRPTGDLDVSFNPVQGYDPATGDALFTLQLTCSEPATFVISKGRLEQGGYLTPLRAAPFSGRLACEGSVEHVFRLATSDGRFAPGQARVSFVVHVDAFFGGMSNWLGNQPLTLVPGV